MEKCKHGVPVKGWDNRCFKCDPLLGAAIPEGEERSLGQLIKEGFKAEDFNFDVTIEGHQGCDPEPRHLAARATAILREAMGQAVRVYGPTVYSEYPEAKEVYRTWATLETEGDTHTGIIVGITPLEKKG